MREKTHFRSCPKCSKTVGHTSARGRDACEGRVCRSCSNRKVKTGVPPSEEAKAKQLAARQNKIDVWTEMYGEKSSLCSANKKIQKWGKQVKERDNYTCKRCDTVGSGYNIHAHHFTPKEYYPHQAFDISNGITLCRSCHQKIHNELDNLTMAGIKLDAEGFVAHASNFINPSVPLSSSVLKEDDSNARA